MLTNNNDYLGFDKRLVQAAIRRSGLPITPENCMHAKDAIADAIMKYDPDKNDGRALTLKAWVYTYIRWQIRRYVKPAKKQVVTVSLDKPLATTFSYNNRDEGQAMLADMIAAPINVENIALNNIMFEQLENAISQMDEKGQFIMRFVIEAANPQRCGQELGTILAENGMVKSRGNNRRERARQLIGKYTDQMRKILAKMGIEKASDLYNNPADTSY